MKFLLFMLSLATVLGGYAILDVPQDLSYDEVVTRAVSGVMMVIMGGILMMFSIGMRDK